MARNTDIRLAINLPFHPKLRRLVKRFGPAAGWAWIVLLCHVGADRPDGCLGSLSDEEIAIAAEWDGDAEEFVSALISYRLLDRTEEGLAVHDWAEHNPWAAGANGRAEAARKAGKASADARKLRNGRSTDVERTLNGRSTDFNGTSTDVERTLNGRSTPSPSPSPSPSPTPDVNERERVARAGANATPEQIGIDAGLRLMRLERFKRIVERHPCKTSLERAAFEMAKRCPTDFDASKADDHHAAWCAKPGGWPGQDSELHWFFYNGTWRDIPPAVQPRASPSPRQSGRVTAADLLREAEELERGAIPSNPGDGRPDGGLAPSGLAS